MFLKLSDIPKGEFIYDAFISHRHLPHDRAVAERLQKLLEEYKPPINGRYAEAGRMLRVFRDESDLPANGVLGTDIKLALQKSAFLIVVLTGETSKSRWLMEEISYYKAIHRGRIDHILLIMADGMGKDKIPEELRTEVRLVVDNGIPREQKVNAAPFILDISSSNSQGALKRLSKDFLKLAAPIHGTLPSQLYSAEKKQFIRTLVRAAAVVAVVIGVWGGYTLIKGLSAGTNGAQPSGEPGDLQSAYEEMLKKNEALLEENKKLSNTIDSQEAIRKQEEQDRLDAGKNHGEETPLPAPSEGSDQENAPEKTPETTPTPSLSPPVQTPVSDKSLSQAELSLLEQSLKTLETAEKLIDEGNRSAAALIVNDMLKGLDKPSDYIKERAQSLLDEAKARPFETYAVISKTQGGTSSLRFSKDGKQLYALTRDKKAVAYDMGTGRLLGSFDQSAGLVDLWPTATGFLTLNEGFTVSSWNTADGKKLWETRYTLDGGKGGEASALFSNGQSNFAYIKDGAASKGYLALAGANSSKAAVQFEWTPAGDRWGISEDGRYFLAASTEGLLILDTTAGTRISAPLNGHRIERILCASGKITVIGENMSTGYYDILLVDYKGTVLSRITGDETSGLTAADRLSTAVLSQDGNFLALVWSQGTGSLYDLAKKAFVKNVTATGGASSHAALTRDGNYFVVASGTGGKIIDIWKKEAQTYTYYGQAVPPGGDTAGFFLSLDGTALAIPDTSGKIGLYSLLQ